MNNEVFPISLIERKDWIKNELASFKFKPETTNKINFLGGQFLSLHINDHKRHYSIAHDPKDPFIEIACTYLPGGLASEKLFNLSIGDRVLASAPYGKFIFHDLPVTRYVLVATGTGVSPYRSMLPQLKAKLNQGISIILLFGCRTKQHILYFDDFSKIAQDFPNFQYIICCSREQDPLPFYKGHVQTMLTQINLNQNDAIFICGNPNMVQEVYALSSAVPNNQIFREKYVVAGHKS